MSEIPAPDRGEDTHDGIDEYKCEIDDEVGAGEKVEVRWFGELHYYNV